MATPKAWQNDESGGTKLNKDSLIDLERRMWGASIDSLEVIGHSIAAAGGARFLPEGGYPFRLRQMLGVRRFRDYSTGGAIACYPTAFAVGDGGASWILQNVLRPGNINMPGAGPPYVPWSQLVLAHIGLNDLPILGSLKPAPFQVALRTILARFCASAVYEKDSAAWAYTGTWAASAQTAYNSGAAVQYTVTVNDYATLSIPADFPAGRVIGIGLFLNNQKNTTIGVTIDGVARPDIVLDGPSLCDTLTNKHQTVTVRFGTGIGGDTALAAGAHTIVLTLKSGTAPMLAINFSHIEADPAHGPLLICPLPNKPANYSVWNTWAHGPSAGTDPMNDAAVDSWKLSQQSVHAEFPGRIVEVDIDALGLVRTAGGVGDFISDGAHPTERGHGLIAEGCRAALLPATNPNPTIAALLDNLRYRPAPNPKYPWKTIGVLNGAGGFATGWGSGSATAGTIPPQWRKDEQNRVTVRGRFSCFSTNQLALAAGALPKPVGFAVQQAPMWTSGGGWSSANMQVQRDGSLLCNNAINGAVYELNLIYDAEAY